MPGSESKAAGGFDAAAVAALARLDLSPAEAEALGKDLAKILDYAAGLRSLDTEGVLPTTHPLQTHADVRRADVPREGLPREEALAAAPAHDEGLFRVPRIVGDAGAT